MNWSRIVLALAVGYCIGRITAFRMDIDEYHSRRMDFEEQLEVVQGAAGESE